MNLVLVILLILLLCGGIGGVGYHAGWHPAYIGGGSVGTLLVILLVLYLLGII